MSVTAEAARSGRPGAASRQATVLAVAVTTLFMLAKVSYALAGGGVGQVPWVVALFVLPLLYTLPGGRRRLNRYWWAVLAVQAVLTWVPFAIFGSAWVTGLGGLLAALVLLTVPNRASWLAAGLLAGADVLVRAAVTGLSVPGFPISAWSAAVEAFIVFLDDGLYLFSVVRLAQIVGEVEQAQRQAADLTIARERLRAAQALQAAVGERLAGIAIKTSEARRALARDAEQTRTLIAAAAATARETIARARAVAASQDRAPVKGPQAPPLAGVGIGAKLARVVLAVMLTAYTAQGLNLVFIDHDGARHGASLAVIYLLTIALQLRHSGAARHGHQPRAWPLTLALQAALVYLCYLPPFTGYTTHASFLAASALLLIPGWWRWAAYAVVIISWTALFATVPLPGITAADLGAFNVCYLGALVALTGLAVYALSWLAGLARELDGLREQAARVAAVRERLRVARDVHDLLGLGLSAVALKADLVGALIGRDDARAAAEMAAMARICAAAQADIRLVTGDGARLSLAGELAAAEQILSSAGIDVTARAPEGLLPVTADEVLAPALREAVTNVLRHSSATWCVITVSTSAGILRLEVSNDGAGQRPGLARGSEGRGLLNMTERMQEASGHLTCRQADDNFELTAEIPRP